jgi:type IV pilus assembly protein PilA
MENPYAQSAAPTAATPEQQKILDYQLAVGRNADYYLPKFERFDDDGSLAGWHWPAFFFTSGWYLYRKMWLWGLLNLFFPLIAAMAVGIVAALLQVQSVVTGFVMLGAMFIEQMLLTIFANSLYWKHINGVIRNVPRSIADKPDKRTRRIERDGGTSIGAMFAVLVCVGVFGIGILAAIAVPAYQDYTIRAQTASGLQLASGAKVAVAEYYAQKGEWPRDGATAGVGPVSGPYVESVNVQNGSVVITYGDRVNAKLAGQRLVLLPGVTQGGDVVWTCGEHAGPDDIVTHGPGPHGSDVAAKYLPANCRP